jgi:hypothetical protein
MVAQWLRRLSFEFESGISVAYGCPLRDDIGRTIMRRTADPQKTLNVSANLKIYF